MNNLRFFLSEASAGNCKSSMAGKWFIASLIKGTVFLVCMLSILLVVFVPQAKAYTGVPSYSAQEIEVADTEWGIIPESMQEQDLSIQITRGEFCQVVLLAYQKLSGEAPPETEEDFFCDTDSDYVNAAYSLGVVSGYPDGSFREDSLITRQEMFKMIYNFLIIEDGGQRLHLAEAEEILAAFADSDNLYDWSVIPTAAVIKMGIVKGAGSGFLDVYSYTTSAQAIALVCRTLNSITGASHDQYGGQTEWWSDSDKNPFGGDSFSKNEPDTPLTDLGFNDEKYILIFGALDNPVYLNFAEAAANMVNISINVWTLATDGKKTTSVLYLTVNKAVSEVIKKIFQEIYEGEEKFPIKSVGGYDWRGNNTSQHSLGLAIDINPNENYMIKKDGTIVCGSFWNPAKSPFSIPEDGDVVRAFRKYGFAWGGNAWRSANDYMHFSYFGT